MAYIENTIRQFDLYRYQLLPTTRHVQLDVLRGVQSLDSLKERKNEFFAEALETLSNLPKLQHRNIDIIQRLDMHAGEWFVFHLGARKTLKRIKPDFNRERIEDWPYVIIIINNDADTQLIAISRNTKAFSSSVVVADMLMTNLQPILKTYQLNLEIDALFDQQAFWSLVNQHQGKITSVTFELISPNMSNISKALLIDLAQINAETNAHRTDLKINSSKDSVLEIDENNKFVKSLVDYTSSGGGDIIIRVKGIRNNIRTSRSTLKVNIDELYFRNPTPELLAIIKDLLK